MKTTRDTGHLLELLLRSARAESESSPVLPPGLATRIAAQWVAGKGAAAFSMKLWERFARRAAIACGAAGLVIGLLLHDAWSPARWSAHDDSARGLELVQLEELIWTP